MPELADFATVNTGAVVVGHGELGYYSKEELTNIRSVKG